ncbi:hypothetical protein HanRHA438_Chr08g0332681 [Helianthus annuus]|nr:hypothetical protein HanRHA438_Chr08g0332681 [Helianthus annuus]
MNPSWWGTPAPDEGKYRNTSSSPSWWGTPAPDEGKYRNTSLSPSWAESPTRPRITAEQWASVTNQKQSEPKMTTDLYGNPIQAPVKPAPTTDLYENPLPPVASQCHLFNEAPSSPDPRNSSQTKTALYAEIVKDVSNGESSGGNDSSEHNSSSDEDVSTSVDGDTTSSSSEDGSECESSREGINSDAERPTPESDSSQVCVDEPTAVDCDNCARLRVKCADLEANMSELQGKHDALQASLFGGREERGR